ncbi:hypothetical protein COCHEDRAFT_1217472 [Bipolaris maydis C5]|uniref:Mis6 domain protein n=1 Tax=Cochliobolus heterostrophus (strain C5 / ATCC 48332 / race O) TaxID=701091 RepID=M2SPN7_COCH5|nr:hypothetical protein COCHEDRAFT_1217472 [Bipolaris maydis C5]
MPSVADERPTLQETLNLLHQASRTPAKQRTIKVSSIVDVICRYATEGGLDQDALRDVVQLISVKTSLDQTTITTLIKNLYPARRIPRDVVITVVGALGQGKGKPSPGTQDSLVKWLITVHEIIEEQSVLSRLYSVLFDMLDMISIRTSLCHLLSLITRRKHVKPFRIQQLLELSRGLGNEPALQGLLRVYKDYYPDIILGSTSTSRKSFAPRPDDEWRARIAAIHEASNVVDDSGGEVQNGFKVLRKGPKGSKSSAIPEVHTYHATESSVTLEGIDSVDDFVEKLDRIEPPGQLVSLLVDPLLQKYVDLKPSHISTARISVWLAACLEEQFEAHRQGAGDDGYLNEILGGLLRYAQYTKTLHPGVLAFFREYLPVWNVQDNLDTILGLLSYIDIESFEEVHATYLSFVERAIAAQGISVYPKLINFYTALLQHHISTMVTNTANHGSESNQTLSRMTAHVATLFTSALVSIPAGLGSEVTSCILSFYELVSMSSKPRVVPIQLPPMHLIYLLTQDASATTFARVCGIVGAYKLAFDRHPKPVKAYYPVEATDTFNYCLRDMYNLLWVSRGLVAQDKKSQGLFCDAALRSMLHSYLKKMDREYTIETAFGLSHNAWLAALSAAAWRAMEQDFAEKNGLDPNTMVHHRGPVSEKSLEALKRKGGVSVDWDGGNGYKAWVLQWLDGRGLGGIKELMFATVMNLKGAA